MVLLKTIPAFRWRVRIKEVWLVYTSPLAPISHDIVSYQSDGYTSYQLKISLARNISVVKNRLATKMEISIFVAATKMEILIFVAIQTLRNQAKFSIFVAVPLLFSLLFPLSFPEFLSRFTCSLLLKVILPTHQPLGTHESIFYLLIQDK